jgi:hypothetical protein
MKKGTVISPSNIAEGGIMILGDDGKVYHMELGVWIPQETRISFNIWGTIWAVDIKILDQEEDL